MMNMHLQLAELLRKLQAWEGKDDLESIFDSEDELRYHAKCYLKLFVKIQTSLYCYATFTMIRTGLLSCIWRDLQLVPH